LGDVPATQLLEVLDLLRCGDLEMAKALPSASPWQWVLEMFTTSLQRRSLGSEELQRAAPEARDGRILEVFMEVFSWENPPPIKV